MRSSAIRHFITQPFIKGVCCLFILLGANTYGSTLLVLGDSLSAGYGINQESGWVALLDDDFGDEHRIINGSISGDTTGGGLNRLPRLLEEFSPDYVLLELGGNDGLRGQPLNLMKSNLQAMINLVTPALSQCYLVCACHPIMAAATPMPLPRSIRNYRNLKRYC